MFANAFAQQYMQHFAGKAKEISAALLHASSSSQSNGVTTRS